MKEYIKDIPNWEKNYLESMKGNLTKRQIELLEGAKIRAYEGMIYDHLLAAYFRRFKNYVSGLFTTSVDQKTVSVFGFNRFSAIGIVSVVALVTVAVQMPSFIAENNVTVNKKLFHRRLIIWICAFGVVSYVVNCFDFRDLFLDHNLYSLLQCYIDHSASLATSSKL